MTRVAPLFLVALFIGCSDAKPTTTSARISKDNLAVAELAPQAPAGPAPAGRDGAPAAAPKQPAAKADEPAVERRIIYTASIELVVKSVDEVRPEVERIAAETKGYVAKSDVTGRVGLSRTATWTLKVPVGEYHAAVARLVALGQPVRNSSDSQDVTEEFVDLLARVKNFKAEEETLNKLLKDTAVRLDDILKIREQIKVVRGEIERAEGRLKYLSLMSALSTITFQAREEVSYSPEAPPAAQTFAEQVDSRFTASWQSLVRSIKAVALWAVEITPFLPIYLPVALVLLYAARRLYRYGTTARVTLGERPA